MDKSPEDRPSHQVRWLDAPAPPADAELDELCDVLREHHEIGEAWLLSNRITPDGGDAYEATAIAMTVDAAIEPGSRASVELVAGLGAAVNPALRISSWIFVADGIRAKTERHGLKVYSRT